MSLKDRVKELLDLIEGHSEYIEHNRVLLDIFQGNLRQYIADDMKSSLSPEYFSMIETRLVPINILKRVIDKLSKVYALTPQRSLVEGTTSTDEMLLEYYEDQLKMNVTMNYADEYSNLFKGYLFDLFMSDQKKPAARIIPFDKFLTWSDSVSDPLNPTGIIKFIGKRLVTVIDKRQKSGYKNEMRDVYFAYTKEEFIAFDSNGDIYTPAMEENEGINPYGILPQYYGQRDHNNLIPIQDTDILAMAKVLPVMLSDLAGAIMFQCFSIMYGVDVDSEQIKMSPNAFWSFKSDPQSEKNPQVGTIKPQADIDQVVSYIMNIFTFWLETKGIKVGSTGSLDATNASSGIAKVIDEMDTTELKKVAIKAFEADEKKIWELIKTIHNKWVDDQVLVGFPRFSENFEVIVTFDEPTVIVDREKEVRTIQTEVNAGFLYPEKAIRKLYPDASEEEILKHLDFFNGTEEIKKDDQTAENQDRDKQEL